MENRLDPHVVGQTDNQGHNRRAQADHDDDHLLDVGPRDGLHTAKHCVQRGRNADGQHGQRQTPPEDDREDDRRCRDDDPSAQAAGNQKEKTGEDPRLGVEALFPDTRTP